MGFLMNHCVPRQGGVFSWKGRAEDQDSYFQGGLGREAPEKLIPGGFGAEGTERCSVEGGTVQLLRDNCLSWGWLTWWDMFTQAGGRGWGMQVPGPQEGRTGAGTTRSPPWKTWAREISSSAV